MTTDLFKQITEARREACRVFNGPLPNTCAVSHALEDEILAGLMDGRRLQHDAHQDDEARRTELRKSLRAGTLTFRGLRLELAYFVDPKITFTLSFRQ